MVKDCFLCRSFEDRGGMIYKNDKFFIISDISPLFPNHILFCSNRHEVSFSEFNPTELNEFYLFIMSVKDKMAKLLNKNLVVFEHGGLHIGCKKVCGTNHAHLHILPVPINTNIFTEELDKFIINGTTERFFLKDNITSFPELSKSNFCYYLLTIDIDNTILIYRSHIQFESQLLRKYISSKFHLVDSYDWEIFHSKNQALQTTEFLRNSLF